ncbi:MAG: electron transporter [Thalassobius sp.]|nr:electron transporter [Thalassovita sp.]
MNLHPFIKAPRNTTQAIMLDVIVALIPITIASYLAYGTLALTLLGTAITAAVVTDLVFSGILFGNWKTSLDGSSVITAMLLTFTISPLTPWFVVAFGAATAIIFGKILWGGLGKNLFNPALVGREFMSCIFSSILGASSIWVTSNFIHIPAQDFFLVQDDEPVKTYLSTLLYNPSGALGEYSPFLIMLGGFYLILRKRISWHIPTMLLGVFAMSSIVVGDRVNLDYSFAGLLFGTIFMATDMPSSPNNASGKIYYGAMIGLVTFILVWSGVKFSYLSYSILILNGFSSIISQVFKPNPWGKKTNRLQKSEEIALLTTAILGVTIAVIYLHENHALIYLLVVYVFYVVLKYAFDFRHKLKYPI